MGARIWTFPTTSRRATPPPAWQLSGCPPPPVRAPSRMPISRGRRSSASVPRGSWWTGTDSTAVYHRLVAGSARMLVIDDHGHAGRYQAQVILDQNAGAEPGAYAERPRGFGTAART